MKSPFSLNFETTHDLIRSITYRQSHAHLPPQRWNKNPYDWAKELLLQNVKNVVKLGLRKGK